MTGMFGPFYVFMLFLNVCFSNASLERRFSDFKRCADDECSMLLCRGKAAKDFSGPDCRFLSFKKGETIYVYYKLSGLRSDVWAGSVGSNFGYFPKDFLNINHIYTEKEIEVPAEETDFVCFDTGLDQFKSYDVDLLLSSSLLLNEGDGQSEKPEGLHSEDAEIAAKDAETSSKEFPTAADNEDDKDSDPSSKGEAEDLDEEDGSDLEPVEPVASDAADTESDYVGAAAESKKSEADDAHSEGQSLTRHMADEPPSKDHEALEKEDHVTEVEALPELKTTLGTTFDAVMSDDEDTDRVTAFDEHNKLVAQPSEQVEEKPKEPALLSATKELPYFEDKSPKPGSNLEDFLNEPAVEKQEAAPEVTKDDMWSSLGDTVFKIVSGGERTDLPEDTEDDDDDDDEEEEEEKEEADEKKVDIDADRSEKGSEDHLHDQDSEMNQNTGDTKRSNKDSVTEDPISSKDATAPEIKQTSTDFTTEDEKVSEQASKMLKHDDDDDDEVEELESTESSDVDKISGAIKSKHDTLEDGKQVTEKTVQKVTENVHDSEAEDLSEEAAQNEAQVDDDQHEENLVHVVEGTTKAEQPESEKESDIHETTNEQINSVKNDIVNLSEGTLKAEQEAEDPEEEPDDYEDNEDIEELLEDENAVLSTITELQDKTEEVKESTENGKPKSELKNDELAIHKEPEEISSIQTNEDESNMVESLDLPVDKENDTQPIDGPGKIQQDPVTSKGSDEVASTQTDKDKPNMVESLDSPDDKENNAQSIDGPGKIQQDPVTSKEPDTITSTQTDEDKPSMVASLDSLVSAHEKENDTQSIDGPGEKQQDPVTSRGPEQITSTQANEDTQSNIPSVDSFVSKHDKENDVQPIDGPGEYEQDSVTSKEPEYSDSIMRLTLLRDHFKDNELERIQRYLDLKDLYKVEAMFSELEQELRSARESNSETSDDIERALESILEVSENSILDEIEKMLDAREQKVRDRGQQMDPVMFDEEAAVLDDFQEFAFYLRQKYSAVSDSVPLAEESQSRLEMENVNAPEEDLAKNVPVTKEAAAPEVHEKAEDSSNVNIEEGETHSPDMGLEEDGGHFNKNKDIRAGFEDAEEVQRGPQAILENPLDITFGFEMDPSSGSLESPSASDFYDNKANLRSTSDHVWGWLVAGSEFLGVCTESLIAALPEEWQPGPTFHGLPWKPVVTTAVVGVLTVFMFIWRTILAVKGRAYVLTEKQLAEKIQQLVSEKSDVLLKITELNNMIKQQEEKLKNSEKSQSSTHQEFEGLKTRYQGLLSQREELSVNVSQLGQKIADTQKENKALSEKVVTMHQRIEKHQNSLRKSEEERSKIQVLMDEAKLREDALKAQVLSFEKDNSALKEQKKNLLRDAKDWQEKHEKLSEEIKVYHKTQKDLEDSLVHKENEIDVLSSCIAELKGLEVMDCTELQKGDAKLANGEPTDKKGDPIKLRLKQMMDVSRIKATLSIVEDERNRCLENFMAEQKARQELEEQFQKVVHDQTKLKNEKTHLETQYNNLQQRLEITTELYQQKENVLQQKLTQEELERREKETKLSEVDGRAVQAEEELNSLRQKVKDMQEEMQQNERALKAEIAVQEKKAHENWLKARASERSLIEERRESANLRQKIVECSDRMSDLEHSLYKSGPPERHVPLRRGDSYGPSPVSGGAPSPPLMIEGPGRPPSAPVGRRNEPYGPQPPPDAHGRFSDLGHPLPSRPDMQAFAPRTSSPCTQDGSFQLSKSQSQGSFLPSPIRDSPAPTSNAHSKGYVPQPMGGPPNGAHPSMIRPPNGHPSMIPSGPPLGPDPHFRPPHMDSYGPPLRPFGPVPPPFVRGPHLRDLPPMRPPLPPFGAHDFPPDFAGPRDLPFPPRPFPPGSLPPPGAMVPPPFGARDLRGATPLMGPSSRDGETGHATETSSQQGASQDTVTSGMAEP